MKQFDKYLLRLYAGPFLITFMISVFILIMQFLWLYIDELLGKGVPFILVLELVLYWSSIILPLAIPLTILISSILTFGNLGESLELTAVKSAGISLIKFGRALFIVNFMLAIGLFLFQNYVAPKFNLNAYALLHDIRTKKPAFNLIPNVFFNELDGYSIKIGAKDRDENLYDIFIYDHKDHMGVNKIIYAEKGKLLNDQENKLLVFELQDGYRIEEKPERHKQEYQNQKAYFDYWSLSFDQSQLDIKRIDKEALRNNPMLMNNAQLTQYVKHVDSSIHKTSTAIMGSFSGRLNFKKNQEFYRPKPKEQSMTDIKSEPDDPRAAVEKMRLNQGIRGNNAHGDLYKLHTMEDARPIKDRYPLAESDYSPFLRSLSARQLNPVINRSRANLNTIKSSIEMNQSNLEIFEKQKIAAKVEWHRKISVSVACILLFIIAASLGAIIRKGGLGIPILFAVVFFIFYYVIMAFGEKFAKQGKISPFLGEWFASFILAPIAIFLLIKVLNDSPLFNRDLYAGFWRQAKPLISKTMNVFTKS